MKILVRLFSFSLILFLLFIINTAYPVTKNLRQDGILSEKDKPDEILAAKLLAQEMGTYYGGSNDDEITDMKIDSKGNIFVTGWTYSKNNISTLGSFLETAPSGKNAFLARFDASGQRLWGTYFGGELDDEAIGIAIDIDDNIFITGTTNSTTGIFSAAPWQKKLNGETDAFLAKFDNSGSLIWCTYFGGEKSEKVYGIAIDNTYHIYITGVTNSTSNIASAGSWQQNLNGESDGFLAKFDESGNLNWGTYYGGEYADTARAVAISVDSNIFITGLTKSFKNISYGNVYKDKLIDTVDGFIAKFTKDGSLALATYFGGKKNDAGYSIAVDTKNNILVTGKTFSADSIATKDGFQGSKLPPMYISFIMKFSNDLKKIWGSYYGRGSVADDYSTKVITDLADFIYITGSTKSKINISTINCFNDTLKTDSTDAYIAKISPACKLVWGTYFGGSGIDYGNVLCINKSKIFSAGKTSSADGISTSSSHQPSFSGRSDGFISCLNNINQVSFKVIGQVDYPPNKLIGIPVFLNIMLSSGQWQFYDKQVSDSDGMVNFDITGINTKYFQLEYNPINNKYKYEKLDSLSLEDLLLLKVFKLYPSNYFDQIINSKSNVDFQTTNYGNFGMDVRNGKGGLFWPRGTKNEYVFGSGIWFGAKKKDSSGNYQKLVEMSYNPNNGRSWMVPGRIEDDEKLFCVDSMKYLTISSLNFDKTDGNPLGNNNGFKWPIWEEASSEISKYFGNYIDDNNSRNLAMFPSGPVVKSSEDIFSTFKDTYLFYFDGGDSLRRSQGYPLHLQFEQNIYTYDLPVLKDMIIIYYNIINFSKDTLIDCWFGNVWDIDICAPNNTREGAANDHFSYYFDDSTLKLCYAWSDTTNGDAGHGLGYVGLSMLMSPKVDNTGRIITDDPLYRPLKQQLGMKTFRNWVITVDKIFDFERYDFISSYQLDGDDGPGDKRSLFASGPFNFYPGDTARFAVLVCFAKSPFGFLADNSSGLQELVNNVKEGFDFFYNKQMVNVQENEIINPKDIEIFPNPASDYVIVYLQSNDLSNIDYSVYGILENQAVIEKNSFSQLGNKIFISTKNLPAGSYYLKVNNKGKVSVKGFSVFR